MPAVDVAAALRCPACGYDLSGTPGGVCSQCGAAFDRTRLRSNSRSRSLARSALGWVARIAVALLFVYAAWGKIGNPAEFQKEVRAYEMAPVEWTNIIAYVVPWLEVTTALLLVTGFWRREARLILAIMLVAFAIMKTVVLSQGRSIECGCVSSDSFLAFAFHGWAGVVTNLVLLGLLGVDAWGERNRERVRPQP